MVFKTKKRGSIVIVSAPSGTGKTTVVDELVNEYPNEVCRVIGTTTRAPRGHEVDGKDYHFLSEQEFDDKIAKGEFLEHQKIFEHRYGTQKEDVEGIVSAGKHAFLVIDVQGAEALLKKMDAVSIFLLPPSFEELENRIRGRKQDDEEAIKLRLSKAKGEMEKVKHYKYVVTNEVVKEAASIIRSIVVATEHLQKGE